MLGRVLVFPLLGVTPAQSEAGPAPGVPLVVWREPPTTLAPQASPLATPPAPAYDSKLLVRKSPGLRAARKVAANAKQILVAANAELELAAAPDHHQAALNLGRSFIAETDRDERRRLRREARKKARKGAREAARTAARLASKVGNTSVDAGIENGQHSSPVDLQNSVATAYAPTAAERDNQATAEAAGSEEDGEEHGNPATAFGGNATDGIVEEQTGTMNIVNSSNAPIAMYEAVTHSPAEQHAGVLVDDGMLGKGLIVGAFVLFLVGCGLVVDPHRKALAL